MSEALIQQNNYKKEQAQFAKDQIKSDNILLTLRCRGKNCKKVLGKVNEKKQLITESSRSGSWIKTTMEKGEVECKKCGNILYWDSQKLET